MLLETGREEERQIIYHDALASSHENFQSIQSKKEMKRKGIERQIDEINKFGVLIFKYSNYENLYNINQLLI